MGEARTPFLFVALLLAVFVVALELGSPHLAGGRDATFQFAQQRDQLDVDVPDTPDVEEPPGRAISYMALIDVLLAFTLGLMALTFVIPQRTQARVQGVVTLIVSIVLIIVALVLAIIALIELIVMVSLFFAAPFGTIAYLVVWGFFPRGEATAILAVLMFLKLMLAACLLIADWRYLKIKSLVLLILTSLVANIIVSFLQGIVPIILVSITDCLAAIVLAIIAIVWAIVMLIGSIPAIVKAVRVTVTTARGE